MSLVVSRTVLFSLEQEKGIDKGDHMAIGWLLNQWITSTNMAIMAWKQRKITHKDHKNDSEP